tara:strand:- start:3739 stop:4245 length:507 start_codon:yes stop_codon:yes gene_type:complete
LVKKNKKNKGIGKLASLSVLVILIGITIYYFYSAEQGQNRGFEFGNQLQMIQQDLATEQSEFKSNVSMWKEHSITTEEMLDFSQNHIKNMNQILLEYDKLQIPDSFSGAVKLFRLSTETQLESDIHYINWIKSGDESEKIRSYEILQQSFEYEMAALTSYNDAKGTNP